MKRAILHMDLDTFFVSVERLKNPDLIEKSVIVGGGERGVVASCSYEARKFGVHAGMPTKQAEKLCPEAIWIKGDMGSYKYFSDLITTIIADNTPNYEKASIDEFYIDLTGLDTFYNAFEHAKKLRREIIRQTGLPLSMALSTNKTVSKIATGFAKPNGEICIEAGNEKEFLAPLPISKIPMAGEKTCSLLISRKINTIGELASVPVELLQNILGKYGATLWEKANGICYSEVVKHQDHKSISQETTFDTDLSDEEQIKSIISGMCERLAYKLRSQQKSTNCIAVKIRFSDFKTFTRQIHIANAVNDHLITQQAIKLFVDIFQPEMKIRLIGVRLSGLKSSTIQTNLFIDQDKDMKLNHAVDEIRNKYGWKKINKANSTVNYR